MASRLEKKKRLHSCVSTRKGPPGGGNGGKDGRVGVSPRSLQLQMGTDLEYNLLSRDC